MCAGEPYEVLTLVGKSREILSHKRESTGFVPRSETQIIVEPS
jgi:hypothetical protein